MGDQLRDSALGQGGALQDSAKQLGQALGPLVEGEPSPPPEPSRVAPALVKMLEAQSDELAKSAERFVHLLDDLEAPKPDAPTA